MAHLFRQALSSTVQRCFGVKKISNYTKDKFTKPLTLKNFLKDFDEEEINNGAKIMMLSHTIPEKLLREIIIKDYTAKSGKRWEDSKANNAEIMGAIPLEERRQFAGYDEKNLSEFHLLMLIRLIKCLKIDAPVKEFENLQRMQRKVRWDFTNGRQKSYKDYCDYYHLACSLLSEVGIDKNELHDFHPNPHKKSSKENDLEDE